MCLEFHAWAFDVIITYEYLKQDFKLKKKTFFLVSKVLSLRFIKQATKNVVDTTFKYIFK